MAIKPWAGRCRGHGGHAGHVLSGDRLSYLQRQNKRPPRKPWGAMEDLRPRLMMINYQDPDYVHWGNASHYTRAISVIDDGLRQLVEAVEHSDHYSGNTIFVVVPDCGRDANDLMSVPYQHHFNSRSAHEIWALIFGAGIARNRVIEREVDQTAIASTIAALMGFRAGRSEGDVLSGISA